MWKPSVEMKMQWAIKSSLICDARPWLPYTEFSANCDVKKITSVSLIMDEIIDIIHFKSLFVCQIFSKSHTVVLKNGVIACWHPEKSFPYEHSKPIAAEELQSVSQVIQMEYDSFNSNILSKETKRIAELRGSLARTGPSNHMLREIFYTGKHEWYTRYREERLRSVAAPDPKRR
ncbi:unnamed protein product [Thelazia callipaeda]|uniref:Large ribosomal subunit protein mL42 n=1 Tax=Thelazia callipaeda TaxID=103827 RepID=A0A0N5D492_THECL|nr:unnamed protein product [Thelazia callipaeda]